MKTKWMLNFLLIALAFNAVSPLLAIEEQKNTRQLPLDEDMTGLLNVNLNPIPAIKNCAFGIGNSISGTFSSFGDSLSKNYVLAMLGRAAKEIGSFGYWVGSGAFSVAGKIRNLYFEKPETLEGFSKSTALLTAALGVSAYFIVKQYRALCDIEKKIGNSELENPKEDFLFGSWNCNVPGYKTAYDILANPEIIGELKKDRGNFLTEKVQKALKEEMEKLEAWLKVIGCLTDASYNIFELVQGRDKRRTNAEPSTYIGYQGEALRAECINYLYGLDEFALEGFHTDLIEKKCTYDVYKRILFIPPYWWDALSIWNWRITIWYKKATNLYWKVYTRYLRTCALSKKANDKESSGNLQPPVNQYTCNIYPGGVSPSAPNIKNSSTPLIYPNIDPNIEN